MTRLPVIVASLSVLAIAFSFETTGASADEGFAASEYKKLNLTKDPQAAAPGIYNLDPHHTSVTARLAHEDLSHYTLRFNTIKGQFTFDPAHPTLSPIAIDIDPSSIDTGDQNFNKTIASRFLESDKYPSITFTSTAIATTGDQGVVDGILDFHGIKKPVRLKVTFNGFTNLDNQPRMGFSGDLTFKRSDFGVSAWIPLEGDDVTVHIETEFTKAK